jgi:hypothetical protein
MRKLVVLIGCALLAACATSTIDLSQVQQFSKHVDAASAAIAKLPDAYVASCDTMIEYEGESRLGTLGSSPSVIGNELTTRPVGDLATPAPANAPPAAASSPPAPSPAITPGPTCDSFVALGARWKQLNDTVILYVKGLGAVAGVTTAPSEQKYKDLADKISSTGLLSTSIAEPAASFVAAIGNRVVAGQQSRDITDLVNLSQRDDVLKKVLGAGQDAARDARLQLVATKAVVDSRYGRVIATEVRLLRSLRLAAGLDPDPAPMQVSVGQLPAARPGPSRLDIPTLTARLETLRLTILTQRARWGAVDSGLQAQDEKLRAYGATMHDIGQVNDALVQQKSGLAGLVAAVRPWVDDLGDQANTLIGAVTATPAPSN